MRIQHFTSRLRARMVLNFFFILIVLATLVAGYTLYQTQARTAKPAPVHPMAVNQAFQQASATYGVPVALLKAICYTEGRLSNNAGEESRDHGFGCMHLVKNSYADTFDRAAKELGVSTRLLKQDVSVNIFGGAVILRDDALQLSNNQTLPAHLADWYGAVAVYSTAQIHSTALLYADKIYQILKKGFKAKASTGELVTLAPQKVQPNTVTANTAKFHASTALPSGCANDGNVDYPGAIDCILKPTSTYDCNNQASPSDCNYTSSNRPSSCTVEYSPTNIVVTNPCKIDQIVIHDTEGSLTSALSVFQCPAFNAGCEQASVQYIIDTDGTVYQVLHESDIAYHDGNFWSNMHSIGIEHVGYDATGYQWYNSAQYLASAKLVAYLLKKYNLPLDRSRIVAHGTEPAATLGSSPNHVDPGPYWLWDYYFHLISQQGVKLSTSTPRNTITLRPNTDQALNGPAGPYGQEETSADYNFFSLYTGPSTKSGLIPAQNTSDPTDVSYNVEPGISYYFTNKVQDPGGSGDTLYQIWYGEEDQVHNSSPSYFANAKQAWLAVPPGDGVEGYGQPFYRNMSVTVGSTGSIYSQPTTSSADIIGGAPAGAIFTTGYVLTEDRTNNLWYEINYNHRQGWIPANEVASSGSGPYNPN